MNHILIECPQLNHLYQQCHFGSTLKELFSNTSVNDITYYLLALDLLPCIFAHRFFMFQFFFSSQFAANCYICIGVTLQQKVAVTDFHFHRLTQDSGGEGYAKVLQWQKSLSPLAVLA